jgi:1-acyl-sn-glycerol-3-phosphate acyltransferase
MRTLRAFTRAILLVSWTAGWTLVQSVMLGLLAVAERGWLPLRPLVSTRDAGTSLWAAGCCRILGLRIETKGKPAPEPPFLLVSNHLGYVDVVLLSSITGGVMVAKKEIRSWPGVGYAADVGGTVFIDRRAHRDILRVNSAIEEAVDRGQGIIFFPEGTSTRGAEVLDFRGSLLLPFAGTTRPIQYASIRYETPEGEPPASTHVCWWGDMTFADHVWDLLKISRIHATVHFGTYHPDGDSDRKELAAALTDEVRDVFVPTANAEEPDAAVVE